MAFTPHQKLTPISSRRTSRPISEINVTPFVDVMLVLLIIFMVTAPLMTVGVSVDLPKANAPSISENIEPLIISLDKDGNVYLQETQIDIEQIAPRLKAITQENMETRIFVRGDQKLRYGAIMEVMGAINSAGFHKVALIAELPSPSSKG